MTQTAIPDPEATVAAPEAQIGRVARSIREDTPAEPPWLIPNMIARGGITEVNGREKVGKGYWETYLIGALEHGDDTIMGPNPVGKVRTLIYTEEPTQSLKEKFDLFDINDAMVVYHWELAGKDWLEVIEWLVQNAVRLECGLIFIDNISAATKTFDEAGVELARKVEPLGAKAKEFDLAVLYDRHQRKAAGKVEDLARGGTALGGAVDVIVSMQKDGRGRERKLTSWGRLWSTNWEKQVELTEEHNDYLLLGGDFRTRKLFERPEWTVKEYAKAIERGEDTARTYLQDHPNVEERKGAGKNGADLYIVTQPPGLD